MGLNSAMHQLKLPTLRQFVLEALAHFPSIREHAGFVNLLLELTLTVHVRGERSNVDVADEALWPGIMQVLRHSSSSDAVSREIRLFMEEWQ